MSTCIPGMEGFHVAWLKGISAPERRIVERYNATFVQIAADCAARYEAEQAADSVPSVGRAPSASV